uniref:Uncharacterized protein n=1 Tax=Picea sitchensis TaxID=3332 RepID=A9NW45_PICSI|nr:unknown [Picea sitchensis]
MLTLVVWCQKFVEPQTIKTKRRVVENITSQCLQKEGCMYLQQVIMKINCPSSTQQVLVDSSLNL